MLKLGPAVFMLNPAYEDEKRPPAPDATRVAAHEDTTLYFGCDDLDALHTYLRRNGVDAQPPQVTNYGMRQLYLKDPDGYALCFQHATK
jgi:hypothetical protein